MSARNKLRGLVASASGAWALIPLWLVLGLFELNTSWVAVAQEASEPLLVRPLTCGEAANEISDGDIQEVRFPQSKPVSIKQRDLGNSYIYTVMGGEGCYVQIEGTSYNIQNLAEFIMPQPILPESERYYPDTINRIVREARLAAKEECSSRPLVIYSGSREAREEKCRADVSLRYLKSSYLLTFHQGEFSPRRMVQVIVSDGQISGYGIFFLPMDGDPILEAQTDYGN